MHLLMHEINKTGTHSQKGTYQMFQIFLCDWKPTMLIKNSEKQLAELFTILWGKGEINMVITWSWHFRMNNNLMDALTWLFIYYVNMHNFNPYSGSHEACSMGIPLFYYWKIFICSANAHCQQFLFHSCHARHMLIMGYFVKSLARGRQKVVMTAQAKGHIINMSRVADGGYKPNAF